MDAMYGLLFLLTVLHFLPMETVACPTGCNCDNSSISCCTPGQDLPITIIGTPNITKLNLDSCYGLDITRRTFANFENLVELTIRHTSIIFIDDSSFSGLKSLSRLILNDVTLRSVDLHQAAFQNLPLQHLDLSNNSLTIINSQMFSGLRKLQTLNLSWNKIKLIQDGAFESLQQLSYLNLDYNSLITITPLWFKSAANYSSLQISLTGNGLSQECEYRGVRLAGNQWFTESIVPNISISNKELKLPECSKPSFNGLFTDVYVQEPFPIGLECSANGYPSPKLTWLLPSGIPVSSSTSSIYVKNGVLFLNPVQPSMAGLYACTAINSEGYAAKLFRLVVMPLPAPRPTTTTTTTAIAYTASTILRQPITHAEQSKTSVILIWVCIGLLCLALAFFLFYVSKKAFKWGKKKTSTGFEFTKFDTPNILMVPENPKPMPHV